MRSSKPYVFTMKKVVLLFCMMIVFIVFSFSTPNQHAPLAVQKITVATYHANIAPLIQANCSPCHFRANGGKKKPLDIATQAQLAK